MTRIDPDPLAPNRKVAQSRLILLNELSAHSLAAQINWDEIIPIENNVVCLERAYLRAAII
jgi:hypothetical protein